MKHSLLLLLLFFAPVLWSQQVEQLKLGPDIAGWRCPLSEVMPLKGV